MGKKQYLCIRREYIIYKNKGCAGFLIYIIFAYANILTIYILGNYLISINVGILYM